MSSIYASTPPSSARYANYIFLHTKEEGRMIRSKRAYFHKTTSNYKYLLLYEL